MKVEETNGVRLDIAKARWVVSVARETGKAGAFVWKRLAAYHDEAPARALYEAEAKRRGTK